MGVLERSENVRRAIQERQVAVAEDRLKHDIERARQDALERQRQHALQAAKAVRVSEKLAAAQEERASFLKVLTARLHRLEN